VRGSKVRNLCKTAKRAKRRNLQDHQAAADNEEIHRLTKENKELRALLDKINSNLPAASAPVIQYRTLCVLVVMCGIVPFRAVPRILEIFRPLLQFSIPIPHFTSVIHWALRVGVAIFSQVGVLAEPWVALIDCSIDIGTRKALIVLRIPLSTLRNRRNAITLQDCECIGMEISNSWNGQRVFEALTTVFDKTGLPVAILKDGGTDLKKGVSLLCEHNPEKKIYSIDDVGHYTANLLKALFAGTKSFVTFLKIVADGAARIRQTVLAWLLPPKIRTKGRFQGITEVALWAQKVLDLIGKRGKPHSNPDSSKARKAFAGLATLRPFLTHFCQVCSVAELFLALMKTYGLNEATYKSAKEILVKLPNNSLLRIRLSAWLDKHISIFRSIGFPDLSLPVSSDPIESLFGKFKTIIQRNPQAELNRLIFIIPLLCGEHSQPNIDRALAQCSHSQMLRAIEQNVPPTLRQTRKRKLLSPPPSVPKSGDSSSQDSG